MKDILLALTFWIVAHSALSGQSELSEDDAVINLLLGPCLFEIAQIELPEYKIDPHAIGEPVGVGSTDSRLSAAAIRVPTRSGTVYYDHDDNYCYVHADGVDAERAMKRLLASLSSSGLQIINYGGRSGQDATGIKIQMVAYEIVPVPPIGGMPRFLMYYPVGEPTKLSAMVALIPLP